MNNYMQLIKENYGIDVVTFQPLVGGWMNDKYIIVDSKQKKYVFKILRAQKVEKMSDGEFSFDYLLNQMNNNFKIQNYMHDNCINTPKIYLTKNSSHYIKNDIGVSIIMEYIDGQHIAKDSITVPMLYEIGKNLALMHNNFEHFDTELYSGKYLKLPDIEELFKKNHEALKSKTNNAEYKELLIIIRENLRLIQKNNVINDIKISLIHGDFADDNIMFYNNKCYILDFELVRVNSCLQDLGRIILSYCYQDNHLDENKVKSILAGYKVYRNLEDSDVALSFIVVWINEVNMWIKEKYFNKEITPKARRFQEELIFLTRSFNKIFESYQFKKIKK